MAANEKRRQNEVLNSGKEGLRSLQEAARRLGGSGQTNEQGRKRKLTAGGF
eukprot:CAMPEP_0170492804 /NCGR_PEP_ID=MMETSP0208-20121228/12893_1 /TAXON_ID=197538 /ORGANISM="Strombidium inclinatum, Strain S3" /LENGTH=50 /DNA_ID=CAMNT_0010768619 /DNA_START=421 /DNA_END=573 /DNA_ORIENTATION=+